MTNRRVGFHAPARSRKPWTTDGSAMPDRHNPRPKTKPAIMPASVPFMYHLSSDHMPHDEHRHDGHGHEGHRRHGRARRKPRQSTNAMTGRATVSQSRSGADQQSGGGQNG